MKTVRSLADVQRLALAHGAELVGSGSHFNAGRARSAASAAPARLPATALPPLVQEDAQLAAPASAGVTREQVEAMLAQHNVRVTQQIGSIISALKNPEKVSTGGTPKQWSFDVTYDSSHAITNVTATATS